MDAEVRLYYAFEVGNVGPWRNRVGIYLKKVAAMRTFVLGNRV